MLWAKAQLKMKKKKKEKQVMGKRMAEEGEEIRQVTWVKSIFKDVGELKSLKPETYGGNK